MSRVTIDLIKVKDIKNGVYVMEDGGLRAVIEVPGVNFSLASEKDKEILVSSFKRLLDGLDFPIQILALSRYVNIERYLSFLQKKLNQETEPLIKFQLEEYINFLKEYVSTHHIMQKTFYVVVPYQSLEEEMGFKLPIFKKSAQQESENFEEKLEQLRVRVSYVIENLSTLGIEPKILNDHELLVLLFELINPSLYWQTVPEEVFQALREINYD